MTSSALSGYNQFEAITPIEAAAPIEAAVSLNGPDSLDGPAPLEAGLDSLDGFAPLGLGEGSVEAAKPPHAESLYGYLEQGFFQQRNDSLLCTSHAHGSSYGVAGEAVPYTLRGDTMITLLLLGCFIIGFISIARSLPFIRRQMKNFFYATHNDDDMYNETSNEMHFQLFLVVINCLLLAIATFQLGSEAITTHFLSLTPHFTSLTILLSPIIRHLSPLTPVILLLSALFLVYFLCKWLIQSMVNVVFFGGKKNIQWIKIQVFIAACFCILIYPMVLLQVYVGLSIENATYYFCFILFLNKIMTFYKCWLIFFRQNGSFLQIILYFCALEITPLLALCGIWLMTIDLLKIIF